MLLGQIEIWLFTNALLWVDPPLDSLLKLLGSPVLQCMLYTIGIEVPKHLKKPLTTTCKDSVHETPIWWRWTDVPIVMTIDFLL